MSDYAIVNLLELDDSVNGRVEGLEGRFGRDRLGFRDLGVSHWRYAPNMRNPVAHTHREQEEAYAWWPAPGACASATRSAISASGMSSGSRPRSCAASNPEPMGSSSIAVGGTEPEGGDGVTSDAPWPDV